MSSFKIKMAKCNNCGRYIKIEYYYQTGVCYRCYKELQIYVRKYNVVFESSKPYTAKKHSINKRRLLSSRVKNKAYMKFNKLYFRFKNIHNCEPDRKQLVGIIVNASHITIRRRGRKGHRGRQKVRKILSEAKGVCKKYIMR